MKIIAFILLSAFSLLMFVNATHIVRTSTGGVNFSVNEDVPFLYNITINNTDIGQDANITRVNITLPIQFNFTGFNGTDASAFFTNINNVLSWSNFSVYVINGSESKNFWFEAAVNNPGNYNIIVTTLNSSGIFSSNISVRVNDTTFPNLAIAFPANNSNSSINNLNVNYTISDNVAISSCWYSNDTYLVNTTLSSCINITSVIWSDGQHKVTIWTNDTSNNINSSSVNFFVDTIPPQVILNTPTQGANWSTASVITRLNATVNDITSGVANVFFNVSNGTNYLIYNATKQGNNWVNNSFDTRVLTEGIHSVIVYAFDYLGNLNNSVTTNFFVDNIFPTLNSSSFSGMYFNGTNYIFSPQNQDGLYDNAVITMNASELIKDWGTTYVYNSLGNTVKWFNSPSGSPDNIYSLTKTWAGDYSNGSFVPDGVYTINTTITDSADNINTFVVGTIFVDNSPPQFSNISINPNPPTEIENVQLNVTLTETNNITLVILEFNGKNYTSINNNSNEYYFTISSGNYTAHDNMTYSWYVNDNLGNFNKSLQQSFIVANRVPIFNGTIPNFNFTENGNFQQINISSYFYDLDNEDKNNLTFGPSSLQNFSIYNISNGILTLAPSFGYRGVTQVAFFANDSYNLTYSNNIVINVTPINHPPRTSLIPNITFNEDTYNANNNTLNLSNYFFDEDGFIVNYNYTNAVNTGNLIISINSGFVNISSTSNWNGNASLYFTALDNQEGLGVSGKVFIFVVPVNDIPIVNVSNKTVSEDSTNSIDLSNYTTDVESNPATFIYYASSENSSKINCSINGVNLNYNPAVDWFGTTYCNLTAFDGTDNSSVFRFNITVINVNDVPNITSTPVTSATEDSPYVYPVTATDKDNLIVPGTDNLVYSLITGSSTMAINSSNGLIAWIPIQSDVGNKNVTVIVNDGKSGNVTQSFIINVANVNDLPTIPILSYPANKTTIFTSSITLNWSASSDEDNNTITYYLFLSNSTNPVFNLSATSIQAIVNGLEDKVNYYWYIVSSDGIGNQTKTETRVFNVSLKNTPVINSFSPSLNLTILENDSQNFDINVSDIDVGDVLIYLWKLNNSTVGSENNYTFITNYSSAGVYQLVANVTDSFGLSASKKWTINVQNNNPPKIISISPSFSTLVIKTNQSQDFVVSAQDFENDSLTYKWFIDGILTNITANNFSYLPSVNGEINLSVQIIDVANNNISNSWEVVASEIPTTKKFTPPETTNFSAIANLSSATGIVFANTNGKIDFGNENINMNNILDLDNNIAIENGIVAINSLTYSQLNKSAIITLKNLRYNSIPKLYYEDKFTKNKAEINKECDFCKLISYTDFPTTNGTVVFKVEHFSSFFAGESGETYNLNLFTNLDLCSNEVRGDLTVDIKSPDSGDIFNPKDNMKIKLEVDNSINESKNVIVEASLYDIDKNRRKEFVKSNDEKIGKKDSRNFDLQITTPEDFNEEDKYILFAKAYEKDNEENQCNYKIISIGLERKEHDIAFENINIAPETISPGKEIEVAADIKNKGNSDEKIYLELSNSDLGIFEKSDRFSLEKFGNRDSLTKNLKLIIPENASQGNYALEIKAVFSNKEVSEYKSFSVIVPKEFKKEIAPIVLNKKQIPVKEENLRVVNFMLVIGIIVLLILIILVMVRKRSRK